MSSPCLAPCHAWPATGQAVRKLDQEITQSKAKYEKATFGKHQSRRRELFMINLTCFLLCHIVQ